MDIVGIQGIDFMINNGCFVAFYKASYYMYEMLSQTACMIKVQ